MSIFNIISKLFNIPLLSVATSFVAKDISKAAIENLASGPVERKQLSSVSTALLLAVGIGMFEALALSLASGPFLRLMGVQSTSEMFVPARQFLMLRALGPLPAPPLLRSTSSLLLSLPSSSSCVFFP
ncbi:PREDICTED: protein DETOXIFICATION 45, chloroplastic-like [Tarenaya hassleriana]|uniref:protein DETOXIFICATION 45, chloroplastic-like n=1 Tax=Tarenaya hassleriana TaxID=28532 RepID=UPI0008FD7726|nr:PREDICTED: protein DETOXIFICATION 45, chloroplastic-like [Tarenaya hassleriana]